MRCRMTLVATYCAEVDIDAPGFDEAVDKAQSLLKENTSVLPEKICKDGIQADFVNLMVGGFRQLDN